MSSLLPHVRERAPGTTVRGARDRTNGLVPALLTMAWMTLTLFACQAAVAASSWEMDVLASYRVVANVTYAQADGYESKLDLWVPREAETPRPTLLYIHGGGWVGGTKEGSQLAVLPWLARGYSVVNVEYRLGRVALAPGAVEDCRCALRWIRNNAERYGLDPGRVVVTGHSAGGHLSLTTGMLRAADGYDRRCPARDSNGAGPADVLEEELEVAAIVNWFGITDVVDLIDGPNAKTYAVAWLGSLPNREQLARHLSPLSHVRDDLPPILTIHGDADTVVPYAHAVQLHAALEKAGTEHRLHTVPGGGHGGFSAVELQDAFASIDAFLDRVLASE